MSCFMLFSFFLFCALVTSQTKMVRLRQCAAQSCRGERWSCFLGFLLQCWKVGMSQCLNLQHVHLTMLAEFTTHTHTHFQYFWMISSFLSSNIFKPLGLTLRNRVEGPKPLSARVAPQCDSQDCLHFCNIPEDGDVQIDIRWYHQDKLKM